MDNKEFKKQLESEKQQLEAFLKVVEKFNLPKEEVEKQINFYLEKISELLKKLGE